MGREALLFRPGNGAAEQAPQRRCRTGRAVGPVVPILPTPYHALPSRERGSRSEVPDGAARPHPRTLFRPGNGAAELKHGSQGRFSGIGSLISSVPGTGRPN